MASGAAAERSAKEDEFEEFEEEDWAFTDKEDPTLWDFEWDTDQVDEAFAAALQAEIEKVTAESAAAPAATAEASGE